MTSISNQPTASRLSSVTRRLRSQLLRSASRVTQIAQLSNAELLPPYAFVQADVLGNLASYIGVAPERISRIVIVGAWHGEEIAQMLSEWSSASIVAFEPSREAFEVLETNFADVPRVTCVNRAVSDRNGMATFREMSVTGNGSLLPLAEEDDETVIVDGMHQTDIYEVPTVSLGEFPLLDDDRPINCLWVDVQGLERLVLEGCGQLLSRTDAAFVEVATTGVTYDGGARFLGLFEFMDSNGFRLASLGTNPITGQGNALWVRR